MKVGLHLRNLGPDATGPLLRKCARIADALPIDDLWIFDHLAIPTDQSQGSDGYYLEALATLAHVAAVTERVALGTCVLVLPYRPALLTAKMVATVQALSGGRMLLGVGVGALEGEFRALGVPRTRRGALADEALELLVRCFADDEVVLNGQKFLFRPRPECPPIMVGGGAPHALVRAARFGIGWMAPSRVDPFTLIEPVATLRKLFDEAGKPAPEISISAELALVDESARRDELTALAEIGITRITYRFPYDDAKTFAKHAESVARLAGR